jgi:hypothetical protein
VPAGYPWLGPAGALVQLASPAPGYEATDLLRGGSHELLRGNVRDRVTNLRRYVLSWPAINEEQVSTLRTLARLPGPLRYLHPLERNLLTVNQSTGTDEYRDTSGVVARFQGSVSSSTAQARSGVRSVAWATGSALGSTGRGMYLYNSTSTIDGTWATIRPLIQHTLSGYLRTTAAVSMQALFDWHDSTGAYLSTSIGTSTPLSTSAWTRVSVTATSPSTAAYGIGAWLNSTTTGAAITVYHDDLQLEEGGAATAWRLGAGTPLVSVDTLTPSIVLADPALGIIWHEVEMVLQEIG